LGQLVLKRDQNVKILRSISISISIPYVPLFCLVPFMSLYVSLCFSSLLSFISSLPQLAWDKILCCCIPKNKEAKFLAYFFSSNLPLARSIISFDFHRPPPSLCIRVNILYFSIQTWYPCPYRLLLFLFGSYHILYICTNYNGTKH
jgi:hypothetical protein